MKVSRRGVLAGTAIGGGLVVGWLLRPRSFADPMLLGAGDAAFGAWLTIAPDGVVTVALPQLEMGQGVSTILPQIVAEELGADWRQVAVEPVPPSGAYPNLPLAARWASLWMPFAAGLANDPTDLLTRRFAEGARFDATAAGTTLDAYETSAREAAAMARTMLIEEAAERWDVQPDACDTRAGFVLCGSKRLSFADLAQGAARRSVPDIPILRASPAEQTPVPAGQEVEIPFPRLDLPAKVDGGWRFAGDVRLPGMVHAAIRHGPVGSAALEHFDIDALRGSKGVTGVVRGRDWIAAMGETWWVAERALAAMEPVFGGDGRWADSSAMDAALDQAVRHGDAHNIATRGGGAEGIEKPDLMVRYDVAPAVHAPIETASATAWLHDDRLELWVACQVPESARAAAAEAAGVSLSNTVIYPMPAGGSFDARLSFGHAIEAAVIARETGRPVQLTWSRWQEMLASFPRAPAAVVASVRLGPAGSLEALRTRIAMPPVMRQLGARLFDNRTAQGAIARVSGEADALACAGAMPAYDIPNVAVQHVPVDLPLPVSRMRGGGDAITAFVTESFVDEAAARAKREPLSFRIGMLGRDPRLAECLQQAAHLAEWGSESGQGVACHRMGDEQSGGRIACIATARRGQGGVRVSSLHAVMDIGRIVNLDIARQQVEGGLIFGTSLALGSSTEYETGLPRSARLADLSLPLLADSPEITLKFVASDAPPFDPGEIGTVIAAPAIANALFAATGLRLRRLPLLSGGL
ncbi:molybdopterin-dependent oxidoreductase [Erythrobacter sp. 3-20A1M]|uniref:xanthine dehydrogenase family protein molybdopterin-binding subunit n=1 Tax=Erythrobacter sp. 3-20A1M TaxID=2653850 RepID=UPI001BFC1B37|nr:molybdopterin cofactor-binding domain-containing protein [Erythrobacter sp. 3-20A1M]QWC57355.1 molybdopterin-dependent oxidoreductase [Erythrobacter sp. 3-20A1M]